MADAIGEKPTIPSIKQQVFDPPFKSMLPVVVNFNENADIHHIQEVNEALPRQNLPKKNI